MFVCACTVGRGTYFVHQHFYENKSDSVNDRRTMKAAEGWAGFFHRAWATVSSSCCCCCWPCWRQSAPSAATPTSAPAPSSSARAPASASVSASAATTRPRSAPGAARAAGRIADSEGSNIDDGGDIEAGFSGPTEHTPLISTVSTTRASDSASTRASAKAHSYSEGLIRDAEHEMDSDGDGDDCDGPSFHPGGGGGGVGDIEQGGISGGYVPTNNSNSSHAGRRRKRKKPLSLYGQAAQSLGFARTKIENAAEVQLYTSDQQPAGKVILVNNSTAHK